MKYQIYLNKETSVILNLLATKMEMKPATLIKSILEDTVTPAFNKYNQSKEETNGITRK